MIKYIDFDGVIMNTEPLLFYEYKYLKTKNIFVNKDEYIKNAPWEEILAKSDIIDDSFSILKELDKSYKILTKVSSATNEGKAKIELLRNNDIYLDIILVPSGLCKSDVVDARENVLIDDTVHNLDDWSNSGGIPYFFNKDDIDVDSWNNRNVKYQKIKTLRNIRNI